MDWVTYNMILGVVGLITFGLIYLLLTETFRGSRNQKDRPAKVPGSSHDAVTVAERISLTRPKMPRTMLSRVSSILRRGTPQGLNPSDREKGTEQMPTHR